MHRQLHHEASASDEYPVPGSPNLLRDKSNTVPRTGARASSPSSLFSRLKSKEPKLPARTSSATRLLGKLKARICKSRTLFSHPEEASRQSAVNINHLSALSECTSKALDANSLASKSSAITAFLEEPKETFGCHLCPFEADRITVLDRHLLNHHKLGLENLLKLVMAKTKDGLTEDQNTNLYGIRQPYYKLESEILEDGEFIIETVTPKIKILKHAATNTDKEIKNKPEPVSTKDSLLEMNCQMISKEIESLLNGDKIENADFVSKMKTLNDCMCKFMDSSNTMNRVLTKEFDSKNNVKEHLSGEQFFNLSARDRETSRNWERAHSENMERSRNKYGENGRSDKSKPSAESFYF